MMNKDSVPRFAPAAAILVVAFCCTAFKADDRPDLRTVKSAALAWIDASWTGDASVARQVLVDDESQRTFVEGMLRFSAALRKLENAALKRFGESGRTVTGYPDGSAKAMAAHLVIKEEGDRATVSTGEAMLPLRLQRIDGRWRVDLGETVRDPWLRRANENFRLAAKAAEDVAGEVADGKYKTADDAKAAFRERRLAALKRK